MCPHLAQESVVLVTGPVLSAPEDYDEPRIKRIPGGVGSVSFRISHVRLVPAIALVCYFIRGLLTPREDFTRHTIFVLGTRSPVSSGYFRQRFGAHGHVEQRRRRK